MELLVRGRKAWSRQTLCFVWPGEMAQLFGCGLCRVAEAAGKLSYETKGQEFSVVWNQGASMKITFDLSCGKCACIWKLKAVQRNTHVHTDLLPHTQLWESITGLWLAIMVSKWGGGVSASFHGLLTGSAGCGCCCISACGLWTHPTARWGEVVTLLAKWFWLSPLMERFYWETSSVQYANIYLAV